MAWSEGPVFDPPIMMRASAGSSMTATYRAPWGGDRRVDDGLHVDESMNQLHASGWCVGDTAFVTAAGALDWLVSGRNGENVIRTEGLRNGTQITSRFAWNMISRPWIGAQPGGVQHGRLCTENRTDDEAPVRLAG
jgi:hypothetical protein